MEQINFWETPNPPTKNNWFDSGLTLDELLELTTEEVKTIILEWGQNKNK